MRKSGGNVTIKSIADALGISFSTVSKALNGDPNISAQTRQLVEEKAQEMHYTRNYFAQSLRQKGSKTVAIIVNDIDIPAYGEMVASISSSLAAYGYTTVVSDARYNEEFERSSIQTVLSRMPEAVIIAPADPLGANMQLFAPIQSNTLVLGDVMGAENVNSLAVDHCLAGRISAEHMLNNGNRRNLIFCGPTGYQSSEYYLEGIRQVYEEHGLALEPELIQRFNPDLQTAYRRFLRAWQDSEQGFDGVICFCDSIALGIYRAARELGLQVGQDISVIGYDDSITNEFTEPPLTTIHMPKDLVASHCSNFVINRLVSGDTRQYTYTLQPYLADRGSVRKAGSK